MAESELGAILNAVVDGIIITDSKGTIVTMNRAACAIFGHDDTTMPGQSINVLMPTFWAERHAQFMATYASTAQKRIIGTGRDVYARRKDGSEFPMHIGVGEYTVAGATRFIALVRDLTLKQRREEQLRHLQKMDALGQMTAGLAHDFNNFLTVIIGNLELLQEKALQPDVAPLVQDAAEAAETGSQLIRQMLQFARRGQMRPEALDPAALIRRFAPILEATMGKRIEMILQFPAEVGTVMADPVRLETAILNMALNSRDAMPNGGRFAIEMRIVDVDAEFVAADLAIASGRYLLISVSDTGTGMSVDVQRRAFEPFFSTKGPGQGSGLGLSMVYGFARQSGGHTAIFSELGVGTTINLYLPEYTAPLTGTDPTTRAQPHGRLHFDAHVLLVEDDAKVRDVSRARLQSIGCTVTEASNADEAVRILELGVVFDLVFTDLAVPGQRSGLDLCEHVRAMYPGLPVLLTSGYAEDVVHSDRMRLNEITLLRKPYRNGDLAFQLERLLPDTSTSGAKR